MVDSKNPGDLVQRTSTSSAAEAAHRRAEVSRQADRGRAVRGVPDGAGVGGLGRHRGADLRASWRSSPTGPRRQNHRWKQPSTGSQHHDGTPARAWRSWIVREGNLGWSGGGEVRPTKGYKFSTYATWWIRQGSPGHAHQARTIRIPVHMVERLNQMVRCGRPDRQRAGAHRRRGRGRPGQPRGRPGVMSYDREPVSLERAVGDDRELGDFVAVFDPRQTRTWSRAGSSGTGGIINSLPPAEPVRDRLRFGLDGPAAHPGRGASAACRKRIRQTKRQPAQAAPPSGPAAETTRPDADRSGSSVQPVQGKIARRVARTARSVAHPRPCRLPGANTGSRRRSTGRLRSGRRRPVAPHDCGIGVCGEWLPVTIASRSGPGYRSTSAYPRRRSSPTASHSSSAVAAPGTSRVGHPRSAAGSPTVPPGVHRTGDRHLWLNARSTAAPRRKAQPTVTGAGGSHVHRAARRGLPGLEVPGTGNSVSGDSCRLTVRTRGSSQKMCCTPSPVHVDVTRTRWAPGRHRRCRSPGRWRRRSRRPGPAWRGAGRRRCSPPAGLPRATPPPPPRRWPPPPGRSPRASGRRSGCPRCPGPTTRTSAAA